MRKQSLIALTALFLARASANAQPVRVQYSVDGSAGNWLLNFTLWNDFAAPADMGVYWFGFRSPTLATVTSTANNWYSNGSWTTWSGSRTTYGTSWKTEKVTQLMPGQSISGFSAQVYSFAVPTSLDWFSYAASNSWAESGSAYDGGDNFNGLTYNPGFESSSQGSLPQVQVFDNDAIDGPPPVAEVPEPSTALLIGSGLTLFGYLKRRRRKSVLFRD